MGAKDVLPTLKLTNDTPFVIAPCPHLEHPEGPQLSIVAKGSWQIDANGGLTQLEPQHHYQGDVYANGDPYQELLYPNEMEVWKPSAEVIVIGSCYTPQRQPLTACTCSVRVGSIRKQVAVIGDRHWLPGFGQDLPSEPMPFTRMPLTWSRSFGAPDNPLNPLGTGTRGTMLPNFEDPNNLLRNPDQKVPATGLSPINRMWQSRSELVPASNAKLNDAGYICLDPQTDFHFCNAAPADQRVHGFFRGDEVCEFTNLHPENPNLSTTLPGIALRCLIRTETENQREEREVPMHLDTVIVNLDEGWIECLWRGVTPISNDVMPEVKHILIQSEGLDGEVAETEALQARMAEADIALHPVQIKAKEEAESNYAKVVDKLTRIGVPAASIPALPDLFEIATPPDPATFPFDPDEMAQIQAEKEALAAEHGQKISELFAEAKVDVGSALDQIKNPGDLTGKEDFKEVLANMDPAKAEQAAPSIESWANQALSNMPEEATAKSPFEVLVDTTDKTAQQFTDMGMEIPAELAQVQADLAPGGAYEWVKDEVAAMEAKMAAPGAPLDPSNPELMQAALDEGFSLQGASFAGASLAGCSLVGQSLAQANITNSDFGGCSLNKMEMFESDFSGSRFENVDLSDADLHQSIFQKCIFKDSDLSGANFESAVISEAVFDNCILNETILSLSSGNKAWFSNCKAKGLKADSAEFSEVHIESCEFLESDFSKTGFFTCTLLNSSFVGSSFASVAFLEASVKHCQFIKAELKEMSLSADALVESCSFEGAQADSSSWMWAKFRDCYWTGASLKNANFMFADLPKANFTAADLESANLRGANCKQAIFQQANCLRTTFHQCDLNEADLLGANAYEADFSGAHIDGLNSQQAVLTRSILSGHSSD